MVSESPSVSKIHWTNAEQSRNEFFILFLNRHIHEPKLEVRGHRCDTTFVKCVKPTVNLKYQLVGGAKGKFKYIHEGI